ncbi:LuxR family transcriptional regulator [Glycomyces endophyticus]|uniref:LuxR family transcriptional regulator n=1 Tax=Glycomyces endophyticus TaxID=480996 RepID=A0ABP4TE28_9ACTN
MTDQASGMQADGEHPDTRPARQPPGATGLEPDAEGLYRLLLSRSDATVAQLAADSGRSIDRVRDVLAHLVDEGFATMVADSRFRAVGPDAVLGGRIASQLGEVLGEYEALRELLEIHRAGPASAGTAGSWEVVTGAVAIRSRLRQLKAGAEHSLRTFVRPPMVLPVPEDELHQDLQARGVCHKILFDRAVLDIDPYAEYLRHALDSGDEVRFAKRLPLKLLVVDERTIVMEEPGGGRPRAIVTGNRSIAELAGALFDQLWSSGIPATTAEAGGVRIAEDDAVLLGLLIAGLTDQSIASKLGIGLRTVQRRVRELMDLADVDTRIQLGWHAAKNGWVP